MAAVDEHIAVTEEFLREVIKLIEERDIELSEDVRERFVVYKEMLNVEESN